MIESHSEKDIERKVDQYVNGELSAEEVEDLWVDLVRDEYYLDYLKTAANLREVGKSRKQATIFSLNRNYVGYAAAAVIVLVVAVLTLINYPAFQSGTEIAPVESIELDYYRSESGVMNSHNPDIIRNAITMANSGNVSKAVSLLEQELSSTSDTQWRAELNLNIGSLQYNAGQYEEAVDAFRQVVEKEDLDRLMREKGYWFLGNAYFQLNRLDNARAAIEKAYELNGAYRRVARSYLDALADKQ